MFFMHHISIRMQTWRSNHQVLVRLFRSFLSAAEVDYNLKMKLGCIFCLRLKLLLVQENMIFFVPMWEGEKAPLPLRPSFCACTKCTSTQLVSTVSVNKLFGVQNLSVYEIFKFLLSEINLYVASRDQGCYNKII